MIVFLVEEESMYAALQQLLPKVFPQWREHRDWRCIPHEGKSDLEKSIPRKLRGWRTQGTRFVVLRDQDSADCHSVKLRIRTLCVDAGKPDTLIRIPCHELESWFLGDLGAVAIAFDRPDLARLQTKKKYRNPDHLSNASSEIHELTGVRGKVNRARLIASKMNININKSHSFNVFLSGLRIYASDENS